MAGTKIQFLLQSICEVIHFFRISWVYSNFYVMECKIYEWNSRIIYYCIFFMILSWWCYRTSYTNNLSYFTSSYSPSQSYLISYSQTNRCNLKVYFLSMQPVKFFISNLIFSEYFFSIPFHAYDNYNIFLV